MLVLVTILGDASASGKYQEMVVSGSELCWRRWRKRQATAEIGSPCLRLVPSIMVGAPRTQFFCVSRKKVTDQS